MTLEERNAAIREFFEKECMPILEYKGRDYSGEKDAYRNFKETGADLDIHPRKVAVIFLNKHLDAIRNAIKTNPENPERLMESLRDSFRDSINYLFILAVWPLTMTHKLIPLGGFFLIHPEDNVQTTLVAGTRICVEPLTNWGNLKVGQFITLGSVGIQDTSRNKSASIGTGKAFVTFDRQCNLGMLTLIAYPCEELAPKEEE